MRRKTSTPNTQGFKLANSPEAFSLIAHIPVESLSFAQHLRSSPPPSTSRRKAVRRLKPQKRRGSQTGEDGEVEVDLEELEVTPRCNNKKCLALTRRIENRMAQYEETKQAIHRLQKESAETERHFTEIQREKDVLAGINKTLSETIAEENAAMEELSEQVGGARDERRQLEDQIGECLKLKQRYNAEIRGFKAPPPMKCDVVFAPRGKDGKKPERPQSAPTRKVHKNARWNNLERCLRTTQQLPFEREYLPEPVVQEPEPIGPADSVELDTPWGGKWVHSRLSAAAFGNYTGHPVEVSRRNMQRPQPAFRPSCTRPATVASEQRRKKGTVKAAVPVQPGRPTSAGPSRRPSQSGKESPRAVRGGRTTRNRPQSAGVTRPRFNNAF
mmetsp:Transcript_50622/g.142379  ORF Transcript_50622/g.142379 Transcript_50622/m.142379 type:complete len:386 (+) Transcript_50622:292-1449(+)